MATQKTAQDYREERKARIARSARQNSKKSHRLNGVTMKQRTKNIITIVICAAAVIAIAIGACVNLGVFERMKTIKTGEGKGISVVEYEYYYKTMYNNYANLSQQYDSYYGQGYGVMYTGYDYNKLPEDQEYTGDEYKLDDGGTPTWRQFFEYQALQTLKRTMALDAMAKKEGYKATDEEMKEATSVIDELRSHIQEQADQNNGMVVSIGKYLRQNYGKGMSESLFKKIVEREATANSYYNKLLEDKSTSYTDERIKEEYDKDPTAYDCIDFRLFVIAPENVETAENASTEEAEAAQIKAKEDAKKKAEEMYGKITDEASFKELAEQYATDEQKESVDYKEDTATLNKYTRKSSISGLDESIITWLFADTTKNGDKNKFDIEGTNYLVLMVKTKYKDDTKVVDVRHILYQFDDTLEGDEKTKDDQDKKVSADAALKKIKESANKLDTFLDICADESADTGSNQNGGLYERVGRGQYVKEFEEWSLDPNRKEGDVDVVKTEFGYHVMYFEKAYGKTSWELEITEKLADDDVTKLIDDTLKTPKYTVTATAKLQKLNDKIYGEIKSSFNAANSADSAPVAN